MAFNVAVREQPEFVLVSEYSVQRLGKYPMVRVNFEECVYLTEPTAPLPVTSGIDNNSDQLYEILVVPYLADRADVVGAKIMLDGGTVAGTVIAHSRVITVPADPEADPPVAEEAVGHITLDAGLAAVPSSIAVVERLPTGADAYRRAQSGQTWEHVLDASDATQMGRISLMLGSAYVEAGMALLGALGLNVAQADVEEAVTTLGQAGLTLDAFLAHQAENLEQDRLAGLTPWLTTYGKAP